jgi:hypothetical protein
VTVASDEARNEGGAPQHVGRRANVEVGQAQVASRFIEHGHSSSLHDAVRGQVTQVKGSNVLKYTRDTSLCEPLCTDALRPVDYKVQLKKS